MTEPISQSLHEGEILILTKNQGILAEIGLFWTIFDTF